MQIDNLIHSHSRLSINTAAGDKMASTEPQTPTQSVGPDYVSEKKKPNATVSTEVKLKNVHILQQSPQLIALLTLVSPLGFTLVYLLADHFPV